MARKSYDKKSRSRGGNIQPAAQTLIFSGAISVPAGGSANYYVDLSQCASLVNRRFYRQGLNWAVAGFKFLGGTGPLSTDLTLIQISKLPNTWVMSNAWEKGMRSWSRMNNAALEESPSVRPKFLDFKIYADDVHHTNGVADNLIPSGFQTGEWEMSKFFIPIATPADPSATADREIVATGANYPGPGFSGLNAVSLIEGYAASRGLPNILDPNTPTDAADTAGNTPANWIQAVFNEGTDQSEEVLEELITENNVAPYPFEGVDGLTLDTMYPNGANQGPNLQVHDLEFITNTTIGATTRIKGGSFPCGLIKISVTNASDSEFLPTLLIDLIPGNHRGYLCEPMTEM